MTETGTEKRVDDLRIEMHRSFEQVDRRFELVDRRFDRIEADVRELRSDMKAGDEGLRTEMKEGFATIDARFDSLLQMIVGFQRMMIGFFATTLAGIAAAIIAAVVTHF